MPKKYFLGLELGSTRIKAVLIDENHRPLKSGEYNWKSTYENGIWTYDLKEAWEGVITALSDLGELPEISCMGISAMMHGYLVFDRDWNLLTPFRTWQNTITGRAAEELTALLEFNIPQRWSAAHVYQAVLNKEEHVPRIAHLTTLSGYIHYMLTGVDAVGLGEASGMFPVDSGTQYFDREKLDRFNKRAHERGVEWNLEDILPAVLPAGACAGTIAEEGFGRISKLIAVGTPLCPPEGDAGTGMTATNSVKAGTGNISAGTSIFSMIVLDKQLESVHDEIDLVTTPHGNPVAMVHGNNCTSDLNAWVGILKEAAELTGGSTDDIYTKLFRKSLSGATDCSGVTICNYLSGESVAHLDEGRPIVARKPGSDFSLANFMRAQIYSTMATLRLGMDLLTREGVRIESLTGHGGLFKTPGVAQRFLAAVCRAPVKSMKTSGEGGPYGMALLAAYSARDDKSESLDEYLDRHVFAGTECTVEDPREEDVLGFDEYMKNFVSLLDVERIAVKKI
ncbi:MAG: ATPase [Clostridia bacterium]|nr:ATPase [Clostridia bacterium]